MTPSTYCPEMPGSSVSRRLWDPTLRATLGLLSALAKRPRLPAGTAHPVPKVALAELPDYVQRDIDGMGYATPRATLARERARYEHSHAMARVLYL